MARFEEVKQNRANFEKAEIASRKAFELADKNAQLYQESLKKNAKIAENFKLLEKGWKRKLIWQKVKLPIGMIGTFFLTRQIYR